jgi:hypothetical protein
MLVLQSKITTETNKSFSIVRSYDVDRIALQFLSTFSIFVHRITFVQISRLYKYRIFRCREYFLRTFSCTRFSNFVVCLSLLLNDNNAYHYAFFLCYTTSQDVPPWCDLLHQLRQPMFSVPLSSTSQLSQPLLDPLGPWPRVLLV